MTDHLVILIPKTDEALDIALAIAKTLGYRAHPFAWYKANCVWNDRGREIGIRCLNPNYSGMRSRPSLAPPENYLAQDADERWPSRYVLDLREVMKLEVKGDPIVSETDNDW